MFPLQNINRSYRKGFQRQISLGNTGLKKIGKVSLLWDCAELLFNWDASWISKVIFPWNTHTHTHMHTFPFFHSWENLIHAASEPLSISPSVVIVTEVPMPRFSIHCSLHCITLHPKTVSHYQQFRSYPSTHPPFLCFMDKYRRTEGGKAEIKERKERIKEGKKRRKWNEKFASVWKRGFEVNQPNETWFSLMLSFTSNEPLWIGHDDDSVRPLMCGSSGPNCCTPSMDTKQLLLQFTRKLWTELLYMSLLSSSVLLVACL